MVLKKRNFLIQLKVAKSIIRSMIWWLLLGYGTKCTYTRTDTGSYDNVLARYRIREALDDTNMGDTAVAASTETELSCSARQYSHEPRKSFRVLHDR